MAANGETLKHRNKQTDRQTGRQLCLQRPKMRRVNCCYQLFCVVVRRGIKTQGLERRKMYFNRSFDKVSNDWNRGICRNRLRLI